MAWRSTGRRGEGCTCPRGMLGSARHVLPHLARSGRPRDSLPNGRRLRKPRAPRWSGSDRVARRRSTTASDSDDDGHAARRLQSAGPRPSAHCRLRHLPHWTVRPADSVVSYECPVPTGVPVRHHGMRHWPRHKVHPRMRPELAPGSPPASEHLPVRHRQVRRGLHRHPLAARRRPAWWRWRRRRWWRWRWQSPAPRSARRGSSEGAAERPRGAKRPHRARTRVLCVARASHPGALNHARDSPALRDLAAVRVVAPPKAPGRNGCAMLLGQKPRVGLDGSGLAALAKSLKSSVQEPIRCSRVGRANALFYETRP
jgi:hypothetical protein